MTHNATPAVPPASGKEEGDVRVRVLDYTRTPGGRFPKDGPFPGSEFLAKFLIPAFQEAQDRDVRLVVDLDGTAGYASSFLEESFGGLARRFGVKEAAKRIDVKCDSQPYLITDVKGYIADAETPTSA